MKNTLVRKGEDGSRRWVTTAEDAIRLAELIARHGEWGGRRILSAQSVNKAFPLPFSQGNRLFAEADRSACLLLPSTDVSEQPAFGRLVGEWRKTVRARRLVR